jgi:hypothetical protein
VTGREDDAKRPVSRAVGGLLLGALFFCLLTPIAFVLRRFGRDRLRLSLDPAAPSYWLPRADRREDPMTRQF